MSRAREFLNWAVDVFGPVAVDPRERAMRFLEEAIELSQTLNVPIGTISAVTERVYARAPGRASQEIGQAMVTLEILAESIGFNADTEAAREFDRVRAIPKEEWQARHAAKVQLGIARSSEDHPCQREL